MFITWLLGLLLAMAPPPQADGLAMLHVRVFGAQSGAGAVVSTTAADEQPWLAAMNSSPDPSRYVCENLDKLNASVQNFQGDAVDLSFDPGSVMPEFQGLEIVEDHGERVVMVLVCAHMGDGSERGFAVTDIVSGSAQFNIDLNRHFQASPLLYVFGREH